MSFISKLRLLCHHAIFYISSNTIIISETLSLNCSAKSFPESEFNWEYRNAGSTSNVFQPLDNLNFQTSLTKTKGKLICLKEDHIRNDSLFIKCISVSSSCCISGPTSCILNTEIYQDSHLVF